MCSCKSSRRGVDAETAVQKFFFDSSGIRIILSAPRPGDLYRLLNLIP